MYLYTFKVLSARNTARISTWLCSTRFYYSLGMDKGDNLERIFLAALECCTWRALCNRFHQSGFPQPPLVTYYSGLTYRAPVRIERSILSFKSLVLHCEIVGQLLMTRNKINLSLSCLLLLLPRPSPPLTLLVRRTKVPGFKPRLLLSKLIYLPCGECFPQAFLFSCVNRDNYKAANCLHLVGVKECSFQTVHEKHIPISLT